MGVCPIKLTDMAKKQTPDYARLKAKAKDLYMQGVRQKEIADKLKVSAVTVSKWCRDGGWKPGREAMLTGDSSRLETIQEMIDILIRQRLDLTKEIEEAETAGDKDLKMELLKRGKALTDEMSQLRKEKEETVSRGKKRITLGIYLDVADDIFKRLQRESPDMYRSLLDFQEHLVADISKDLG